MDHTMRTALLLLAALVLAGCAQGPGHTRAAGVLGGTVAGAVVGAALSPCECSGGAEVGALIGMVAGTLAAEGIAQDQERYGWCSRCGATACPGTCGESVPR